MSAPFADLHIETSPETPLADALACWRTEAQHSEFNTGSYRCRYFIWGQGPPLVFIQGLCDRARSFVPMMAPLRRQFQCIGYELPDGGSDGARLKRIQHSQLVDDLFALLDLLALRQTYLFGSSFGSTISLAAMLAHPERVPRSVLQGGFAGDPSPAGSESRVNSSDTDAARWGLSRCGGTCIHKQSAVFVEHDKPEMWNFLTSNSDNVSKAAAARRGLMLDHIDLRPRLAAIQQPVLLISGERDSIVPNSCDRVLVDGLPSVDRV